MNDVSYIAERGLHRSDGHKGLIRAMRGFAALVFVLVSSPGLAQIHRPIVAVMNIEAVGMHLSHANVNLLSSVLTSYLVAAGCCRVVPRDQVKTRLNQYRRESHKACYDQSCQIEIGKLLAANKTITAQVMRVGNRCTVSLKLIDLRSETSESGAVVEGGCKIKGIVDSLKKAVARLTGTLPNSGTVVKPSAQKANPQQTAQTDRPALTHRLFDLLRLDFRQDGVIGDEQTIIAGYKALCKKGLSIACRFREWNHVDGPNLRDAGRVFRPLCDQSNDMACIVWAWSLSQKQNRLAYPDRHAPDPARAARLFQRTCDRGWLHACYNLGEMYYKGVGVSKDPARAARLYRKACDGGNMDGCTALGLMYYNGEGVSKDPARAVRLWRKACDGGDMDGCNGLGWMYDNGKGVPKDKAMAVRLLRKACDGGYMVGCNNLGWMYYNGKGVFKDYARAVRLYRKVCDGGNMDGCKNLGEMYRDGKGVPKDKARAVRLFRKACDGGYMNGCEELERLQ